MTVATTLSPADAMSKAKIALMQVPDSAFFTTLCFSLKHKFDDSIPTACTNGLSVKYNTQFFMALSPDERVSLMLHEAMHCAYLHMTRRGSRDHMIFNMAGDYVINLQLRERGFKIPSTWLCDDQYAGKSSEEVYDLLMQTATKMPLPMADLDESGSGEGNEDGEGNGGMSKEALENEIQDILIRAQIQSKMAGDKVGTIPGQVEIFLDKLLNPKLPWQTILRKFMQNLSKDDYSYRKPNRRYMPQHYLPSLLSDQSLLDIAIAVDTSGSVSDEDFHRFISETAGILRNLKPSKITLLQFDHNLKCVDQVRDMGSLSKVKFTGRGGTDINPIVEWANKNKPKVMIVFTDGEFSSPEESSKVPFIWMIHDNTTFPTPFGKAIFYDLNKAHA